jgi:RNA polymerase sigma factor (sigma-70 family)
MHDIDIALIRACLKQDTRAEYALYKACFQPLMAICYRYTKNKDDALDLLNRGFLKIITHLDKYDTTKAFDKWAKSILINTIIDEFRKNKKDRDMMESIDMTELRTNLHPVDINTAEGNLTEEEVHSYIAKIPEASRLVLNLFTFEGLSHKEIAEQLNISEGTSKWHLSNARGMLKQFISKAMLAIRTYVLL